MTESIANSRQSIVRQRRWWTSAIVLLLAIGFWLSTAPALAQVDTGIGFGTATGLTTRDIRLIVAEIIRAAIGLLGIVALVIVIYGGYLWMTAGGNEERITDAKKWLTNGAIGLAIILLSFSITQFVISRLTDALYGAGTVRTAVEEGGGLPPGVLPGGCVDPGGTEPFICGLSPGRGSIGTYVTIRGYRFGAYVTGQSAVRFGEVEAPPVTCSGEPNWSEHLAVVETPSLDVDRSYPVALTRADGEVSSNPMLFTVSTGDLGPQIACVRPDRGAIGTAIAIEGKRFGETAGSVRFGGDIETVAASWADAAIAASVPAGAQSGELVVVQGEQTSNGYPFIVECAADAECGVNAICVEGQCVEGRRPGVAATEGPIITDVNPQHLIDATSGVVYRSAADVPSGAQAVVAPNGAPGNLLTIRGHGFGVAPGRIVFIGGEGMGDDVVAPLADCATAWGDAQVVAAIPESARIGPIKIETADGQSDVSDDARGPAFEFFRPNTVLRPGVCAVDPPVGMIGATVTVRGVQFGETRDEGIVYFGDRPSVGINAWSAGAIRASVPAIAVGSVEVRVERAGERSNAVAFTREAEPVIPRIREIIPASGGPGQYVTIRGENFGSAVGKITFTRGIEAYEVIPRFPGACRQNWWRGSEITVRIPAVQSEWGPPPPPEEFTPEGEYAVRVYARDGEALRVSEPATFTVTTNPATPGICAIAPLSGPAQSSVSIIGELFGGEGTVVFGGDVRAVAADRGSDFQWLPTEVRDLWVPVAARTGLVRLFAGEDVSESGGPPKTGHENRASNPVSFEVADCRQGGISVCGDGEVCCADGTCTSAGQRCASSANAGAYRWSFSTGEISRAPRVVEACDAERGIFSPAPWDKQGQGTEVCTNAKITMEFTQSMDLGDIIVSGAVTERSAERAVESVAVYKCLAGTDRGSSVGGDFESVLSGWHVLDEEHLTAERRVADADGLAHSGRGTLALTKRVGAVDDPSVVRRSIAGLPSNATIDRQVFAIAAPTSLVPETDGSTYTARVFVRGENPNRNQSRRAGIAIGRGGGPDSSKSGWWQQDVREVVLDGTWQELATTITFDSGPNRTASGFVRLYLTGPPPDETASADDVYTAEFDDLAIVREGDPCAVRDGPLLGLAFSVSDAAEESGRSPRSSAAIAVQPMIGTRWEPGTWYEVIVAGDDTEGLRALRGLNGLRLDGDSDAREGGNYRFRFRTRDSVEPCEIARVAVGPVAVTATQRGPANPNALEQSAAHPGLVHLHADGIADARACYAIDGSGQAWRWSAVQPDSEVFAAGIIGADGALGVEGTGGGRWCLAADDCAVVTCAADNDCASVRGTCDVSRRICRTSFCGAKRCNFTPTGATINYFANTETASAQHETPIRSGESVPVNVRATTLAVEPRTGSAAVVVRFERPRIIATYPAAACQEACTDALISAIVNVPLDPSSISSGSVLLRRCEGENCQWNELDDETGVNIQPTACPELSSANGASCAGVRIGGAPQLALAATSGHLRPNTSYRVIVAASVRGLWGTALEGLNFDRDGDTVPDAYSWTFRTRDGTCAVARVEVSPNPLMLYAVGEHSTIAAAPFSVPDRCNPEGQPLRNQSVNAWAIEDAAGTVGGPVAGFTAVRTTAPHGWTDPTVNNLIYTGWPSNVLPRCTLQCLPSGSRRLSGICGNGVLEVPAEECEKVGTPSTFPGWCDPDSCLRKGAKPVADGETCGNGFVDDGEECDGTSWCNPSSCLRFGSRSGGSVCGNEDVGDGEDCDDGNTTSGDGCSSQCLAEGTLPMWASTRGFGVLARCGDGVVGDGEECDLGSVAASAWAAQHCAYDRCVWTGTASVRNDGTCGNGIVNNGEECDDGQSGMCSFDSEHPGRRCSTNTECGTGGTCEEVGPSSGDGCSASCLLEGSSLYRPAPSICGDGVIFDGRDGRPLGGEACDLGQPATLPDSRQVVAAIGKGATDATGFQRAEATATVSGVTGSAEVRLQCGFNDDNSCDVPSANIAPTTYGITSAGCCALRPLITERSPELGVSGVCRNIEVRVKFNEPMDSGSVGAGLNATDGAVMSRGAMLERCRNGNSCRANDLATVAGAKICKSAAATPETGDEPRCDKGVCSEDKGCFDSIAPWEDIGAVPVVKDDELHFTLTRALEPRATYRVRVLGRGGDSDRAIRSAAGVRFGETTSWTFQTGSNVCQLKRVELSPASYLLNTREAQANITATAYAQTSSGWAAIQPVTGYTWVYTWASTVEDVVARPPASCSGNASCVFAAMEPAKNGEALAQAAAIIAATSTFGDAGSQTIGRSKLRVFMCENPWPTLPVNPATWEPYNLSGENIGLFYCRDFGEQRVCRNDTAKSCRENRDCTGTDAVCISDQSDDLPAFNDPVAPEVTTTVLGNNDPRELRKEFFFLPRGASYCSESGDRCNPDLPGQCPSGEYCRSGSDAVGIRIFENERHVSAERWFSDEGFTDQTQPIELDGYRGVSAGRSVYLNIANLGSVFTNMFVLSVNDGAVAETQEILKRLLDGGIVFNADLADETTRTCTMIVTEPEQTGRCDPGRYCSTIGSLTPCGVDGSCPEGSSCLVTNYTDPYKRCADGLGQSCTSNADCTTPSRTEERIIFRCAGGDRFCVVDADCGADGRCDLNRVVSCTADRDCQIGDRLGQCAAAKDKLARDVRRAEDLIEIRDAIVTQAAGQRRCAVSGAACATNANCGTGEQCIDRAPELASGTFIPGMTMSRWPSWLQEFGQALGMAPPVDPLNAFGGACVAGKKCGGVGIVCTTNADCSTSPAQPEGQRECQPDAANADYEAETCWNQKTGTYSCPAGSYAYQYRRTSGGAWTVSGILEYVGRATGRVFTPSLPSEINLTGDICASTYSSIGRCGDGVRQGDEECEPPGSAGTPTACTATGVSNGFSYRTCQRDCRWSLPSACASNCGNGRVDAGEPCDVGPQGGRVRTYGSTVPGITPDTRYTCSSSCTWSGGYCGNNLLEPAFGEQCDGTGPSSNVATTPSESSSTKFYACTSLTDPTPCKRTGGYCGDGVIQTSSGEQCDGDQVRSCVVGSADLVPNASATPSPWTSDTLPSTTRTNGSKDFPFALQNNATGSLLLSLVTSNDGSDLSGATLDRINNHLGVDMTIADYNPLGAQGGTGVYHRIRVKVDGVLKETLWALASTTSQVTSAVISGIAANSSPHTLTIEWDNNWDESNLYDSDFKFHRVSIAGTQTLSCGVPGTTNACKDAAGAVGLGWGACRAAGAACGNGIVEDGREGRSNLGEECDDGGRGRCSNDAMKACAADTECNAAGQTGNTCNRDADVCTSQCKRNVCGDAATLTPACIGGTREGQPCRASENCGQGGLCVREECDLGISNWRAECRGADATARATDRQCVPNAVCAYGRSCNYCLTTCAVATKRGESQGCISAGTPPSATSTLTFAGKQASNTPPFAGTFPDDSAYIQSNATINYQFQLAAAGSVRIGIETSNSGTGMYNGDLSGVIPENPAVSQPPNTSGPGIYHKLEVHVFSIDGRSPPIEWNGNVWALATHPSRPQRSTFVVPNLTAGSYTVSFNWTNDWNRSGRCSNIISQTCSPLQKDTSISPPEYPAGLLEQNVWDNNAVCMGAALYETLLAEDVGAGDGGDKARGIVTAVVGLITPSSTKEAIIDILKTTDLKDYSQNIIGASIAAAESGYGARCDGALDSNLRIHRVTFQSEQPRLPDGTWDQCVPSLSEGNR
ncbi:MAG: IPT/TIG domain-containing protein [Candidatus Uhrbacteria bacterium]